MSTLEQVKHGLNEAWESLADGWQRLYRRASGAITRFTPGRGRDGEGARGSSEIAVRSAGWGVLTAEVFDDDERIVVRLEAPGLDSEDFDIHVQDDYLVVSGEKHIERESDHGRYHVTECAYGRFERAIPLPSGVQSDAATASYKKGVLRVELPKAPTHRRRSINVVAK